MSRAIPVGRTLAVVAAASLTLAACGSDSKEAAEPQSSASASPKSSDGQLKLGTLLPETGSLAILGPPEIAGVKLAIKEINDGGGVLGKDVLLETKDSGDTKTQIAQQSTDSLLDADVDAIIGTASSSVTLTVIDKITGSGVLQVSPANTSTKLTDYNDKGLYWRTAPSDLFQGRVVGDTAADDGADTMGILAMQDAYGTSLADQAEAAFEAAGGEVKEKIIYNPTASEFSSEVGKLKAADPEAMVLIGFEESSKIIAEMVKQGLLPLKTSGKKLYFVDGNLSNTYDVVPGTLEGVKGTLPGAQPPDDFKKKLAEFDSGLKDYSYAGEAYDAVMLVALAAIAANSDDANDMAAKLKSSSTGGEKCSTFEDCSELAKDGKDFDYEGISGPVEWDDKGDPTYAAMGVYQYGADNKYAPLKFVKGAVAGGSMTTENASGSSATASPSPTSGSSSGSSSGSPSGSSSGSASEEETSSPSPSATSTP
jgi:ABC-type branched-subunit amino acid transport system substrate-binding protein